MNIPNRHNLTADVVLPSLVALGLLLMGLIAFIAAPVERDKAMRIDASDIVQHAKVDLWLRDHLSSGTWKEIAWNCRFMDNDKSHICSIRIRTANNFGADQVNEYQFRIDKNGLLSLVASTADGGNGLIDFGTK